jgi:hypothetical protein
MDTDRCYTLNILRCYSVGARRLSECEWRTPHRVINSNPRARAGDQHQMARVNLAAERLPPHLLGGSRRWHFNSIVTQKCEPRLTATENSRWHTFHYGLLIASVCCFSFGEAVELIKSRKFYWHRERSFARRRYATGASAVCSGCIPMKSPVCSLCCIFPIVCAFEWKNCKLYVS